MSAAPAPKKDPAAVEAEVREKIHLEILKRTGAYHANDHVLLPSGQHTSEYIEKTLVTTEPSFTEGLGEALRAVAGGPRALHRSRRADPFPLRRARAPLTTRRRVRHQGPVGR